MCGHFCHTQTKKPQATSVEMHLHKVLLEKVPIIRMLLVSPTVTALRVWQLLDVDTSSINPTTTCCRLEYLSCAWQVR